MPTSSIARPSKIYPNRDICFKIMPSGNPGVDGNEMANINGSSTCLKLFSLYEIEKKTSF
jgi:hypothetical protein